MPKISQQVIQRASEEEAAAELVIPGMGIPSDELKELLYPGGQVVPNPSTAGGEEAGQVPAEAQEPEYGTDVTAEQPAAETTPAQTPPAEETAEETPVETTEAAPETTEEAQPTKPEWDRVRQQKDEEIARLKKQLAEATKPTEEATAEQPAAEAPVDAVEVEDIAPPAPDDPEVVLSQQEEALVGQLQDFREAKGDDPDPDATAAFNDGVARANLAAQSKLEKIRLELRKVRNAKQANHRNKGALNAIFKEADTAFGAEFHNDALKDVQALWKKNGWDKPGAILPDATHTRLAVRAFYAERKAAKLVKGGSPTAKPKPKSPTSTARGGTPAPRTRASSGDFYHDAFVEAQEAQRK